MTEENYPPNAAIFEPLVLLCGRKVENRLVKVAMYEHLAQFGGGPPNLYHFRVYSEWAKHNWGIVVTGNVAITGDHLTLGRDIVLPAPADMQSDTALFPFRELAKSIHGTYSDGDSTKSARSNNTLAIMQLSHAGRQSVNIIGGRFPFQAPQAPSSIRVVASDSSLASRALNNFLFQRPETMTQSDVMEVINRFVEGAMLAYRTGFDGVQLHAAHGYLLAQFISPMSNHRTDIYSAENALDIIHTISLRIREATSDTFIISIKINASEYTSGSSDKSLSDVEQRALTHLLTMAGWGILDFVEISGGDYQKPDFVTVEDPTRSRRQAFFASFSSKAVESLKEFQRTTSIAPPSILLTGGLKTVGLLSTILENNHANLLGIGRASIICPNLPQIIRERSKDFQGWNDQPFCSEPNSTEPQFLKYPPLSSIRAMIPHVELIGAGATIAWYSLALRQTAIGARNATAAEKRGRLTSVLLMWIPMALYETYLPKHLQSVMIALLPCIAAILICIAY